MKESFLKKKYDYWDRQRNVFCRCPYCRAIHKEPRPPKSLLDWIETNYVKRHKINYQTMVKCKACGRFFWILIYEHKNNKATGLYVYTLKIPPDEK
jgi:hypothetical protein